MSGIIDAPRNYLIRDVQLNWARLDKPVTPFGSEQWEVQIATTSKEQAADWSANYLNVKEKDGMFTVGLKRKVLKADGKPNGKVKVLTADLSPLAEGTMIGNGSVGNVKIYQYPYDVAGRKGTGGSLTAIQVIDLIEYTGTTSDEFSAIESEPTPAKAAAAPTEGDMKSGDLF